MVSNLSDEIRKEIDLLGKDYITNFTVTDLDTKKEDDGYVVSIKFKTFRVGGKELNETLYLQNTDDLGATGIAKKLISKFLLPGFKWVS